MMRTRPRPKNTHHDNSERWLLTYADLITLLLGLFVILYGMSKVDSAKYSKVMQALGGVFGSPVAFNGGTEQPVQAALKDEGAITNKISAAMYEDMKSNLVSLSHDARGIVVHLAEELLFASGSAELKSTSLKSMDVLASVLKTLPNEIRIEGHTDDIPINNAVFSSNWQLSVARAMNTADYLMTRRGVSPNRVNVAGYAQYKPLEPNTSEGNRARNRRVDIVILSTEAPQLTQH